MNIEVINNAKDVKVTVNKNADGTVAILVVEDKKSILSNMKPGSIVELGKSKRRYVVLGHGAETTALVTENYVKTMVFGNDGDYIPSNCRKYLNGDYYEELCGDVGAEHIVKHTVNLIADDGTGKGKTVKDNVSILTNDLYRRYREFIPKVDYPCFTATRVTHDEKTGYSRDVCCVGSYGILGWYDCVYAGGVRPFCILDSSISVLDVTGKA
jgi:hypothetical protein